MNIGDRIRTLRKNINLTQIELAKFLGVSSGAVGLWELSRREPNLDKLCQLSKIFNVTIGYLLGVERENSITIIDDFGNNKTYFLLKSDLDAIGIIIEKLRVDK